MKFLLLPAFIFILSFSVTVVYTGTCAEMKGLTVGLDFGMGVIGAVVIGIFMDHIGIRP